MRRNFKPIILKVYISNENKKKTNHASICTMHINLLVLWKWRSST